MRKIAMAPKEAAGVFGGGTRQGEPLEMRIERLERQNRALEAEVEKARRVARQLQAERDCAREADRSKSMFLAAMSHDLRTPLTAILGFSDLMRQGVFGPIEHPRYQAYAENIHAGGHLLLDIINNILDLSKIEAGKRVLSPHTFEAGKIVADCAALVARAAGERDVAVEIRGAAPVHVDELALRQILINLLSNAVKFTPDGGRVAVGIHAVPTGGTEIAVADTGPGMDEDGIRAALDPFGQVDGQYGDLRTATDIGTGLGLPIAVRLVEMHGGRLDIESEPGRGTTVRIWLPLPSDRP